MRVSQREAELQENDFFKRTGCDAELQSSDHPFTIRMRLLIAVALCLALADAHPFGGFGGRGGRGGRGFSSFGRGFFRVLRSHWTFHQLKCAVTDSDGEGITSFPWYAGLFECEEGTSCEVGPLEVSKWGETFNVTFCNAVDEEGNLLVLRGACLIAYTDDDSVALDDTNGYDFCTGGPLDVEYNGRPAAAFYPEFDDFGCGFGGRRRKTTTTTTPTPEDEGEGTGGEEEEAGGEEEEAGGEEEEAGGEEEEAGGEEEEAGGEETPEEPTEGEAPE